MTIDQMKFNLVFEDVPEGFYEWISKNYFIEKLNIIQIHNLLRNYKEDL